MTDILSFDELLKEGWAPGDKAGEIVWPTDPELRMWKDAAGKTCLSPKLIEQIEKDLARRSNGG